MQFLAFLIVIIFGYLIGSISNGVILGYLVKGVDVRKSGSGNAGGTNTGRVLGKRWGLLTIILDILKSIVSMWTVLFIFRIEAVNTVFNVNPSILSYAAGLACCIGHTFPLFFGFKGGKVVACLGGVILATNWLLAIIGFSIFLIVLFISKFVSLSSITAALSVAIFAFIPFIKIGMVFNYDFNIYYSLLISIVALYLVYRHKQNISRLINHNESKITWLGKKK